MERFTIFWERLAPGLQIKWLGFGLVMSLIIGFGLGRITAVPHISVPSQRSSQVFKSVKGHSSSLKSTTSKTTASQVLVVEIKGEVNRPGVYQLRPGSRIEDLVHDAQGLTSKADQSQLNQAQLLTDQMSILVLPKGQPATVNSSSTTHTTVSSSSNSVATAGGTSKLNLNTASETDFQTLSGIGPKRAQLIVEERTKNGPFKSVNDLKRVSGIGEKTIDRLKDLVTAP